MTDKRNIDVSPRELAFRAGHWLIPLRDGDSKRPAVSAWSSKRVQNLESIIKSENIGLVTGENNIWALDVDSKYAPNLKEYNDFVSAHIERQFARNEYIVQETTSGGLHYIFKLKEFPNGGKWNNKAFAKNSDKRVLLESRGIGGYIKVYDERVFSSLVTIVAIESSRVQKLIDWARSLNQDVETEAKQTSTSKPDINPFELFNDRNKDYSLRYLESIGYTRVGENSIGIQIKRPGDTQSESSGIIFHDTGKLQMFSTSTPFDTERSYSPIDMFMFANDVTKSEAIDLAVEQGLIEDPKLAILFDGVSKSAGIETFDKKKQKKPDYELTNMNDYLQATLSLPKLTYMMDGYICLGQLTFLFGPEKVGKSPIAMEIALNMAKGEKHFGHFRNDAGPIPTLYLDNELQARNLRKRFSSDEEQLNLHKFPKNFYRLNPHKEVTGSMTDKQVMDATLKHIEEGRLNHNIQFVVIDNMAPLIEDEEKAINAKKFISQLIAYADKTDVGILVIQHVTKQYDNQILRTSAMRGSGRLKDMAAGLIGVNINYSTGQRYLKFFPSRNVEVAENKVMKFKTVKPESLIMVEPEGWEQEEVIIQERGEDDGIEELFNLDHVEIGSAFIRLQREGLKADDIATQLGCSRQHLYDCKKVFEKWEKQNIDNKALRDKALTLSPIPSDFDL